MTPTKQFSQLFAYDLWANRRVADVLSIAAGKFLEEPINLFAHIGSAQQIWYNRIDESDTSHIELWPDGQPVGKTLTEVGELHDKWLQLIKSADLDAVISYQNSKGTTFNTQVSGILHHVIIHGQHHRSQIAMLLRQHAVKPPATDFIFYLRESDNN